MNCKTVKLQNYSDKRGILAVLEENKEVPFKIKRMYFLSKTNARRGFHSHKTLQQILICVAGKCFIHVDDGKEKREYCLDTPYEGLYIGNNVWRELYDFSEDAVLIVLASDVYKESDYVRDYSEFIKIINKEAKK